MKITGRRSGETIKQYDSMGGTGGKPKLFYYCAVWDTSKHNIDINYTEQASCSHITCNDSFLKTSMENIKFVSEFKNRDFQ